MSPVGRKESLQCLFKEMIKQQHVVDEYHLWVNTTVQEDLNFINAFAKEHPNFVHLKYGCDPLDPAQMGRAHNVKRFYNYCVEKDTFYFKIDDDVIFIEEGTFEKVAQDKIDNPETFLTYPMTINNYWCTHFLRESKVLDIVGCPTCQMYFHEEFRKQREIMKNTPETMSDNLYEPDPCKYIPMDKFLSPQYTQDSGLAQQLLNLFHAAIVKNQLSKLDIPNFTLVNYEPVSIHFVMWAGEDFAKFNGDIKSVGDEPWLTLFYPLQNNLTNRIVGNTRVVHYAYYTQRNYLNCTDILKKYLELP